MADCRRTLRDCRAKDAAGVPPWFFGGRASLCGIDQRRFPNSSYPRASFAIRTNSSSQSSGRRSASRTNWLMRARRSAGPPG